MGPSSTTNVTINDNRSSAPSVRQKDQTTCRIPSHTTGSIIDTHRIFKRRAPYRSSYRRTDEPATRLPPARPGLRQLGYSIGIYTLSIPRSQSATSPFCSTVGFWPCSQGDMWQGFVKELFSGPLAMTIVCEHGCFLGYEFRNLR